MELERIYFDTFFLYASAILKDIDNILYMKNKVTEHVESCYLWTGPSCILCNTPLIKNESVVYGIANDPQSISAKDMSLQPCVSIVRQSPKTQNSIKIC